ncbi:MAG: hypothetical protein MJ074_07665 [Oscillospiraceae bacterium]|nr:hypothetical protein [Oscillospiraceae bacterium]
MIRKEFTASNGVRMTIIRPELTEAERAARMRIISAAAFALLDKAEARKNAEAPAS